MPLITNRETLFSLLVIAKVLFVVTMFVPTTYITHEPQPIILLHKRLELLHYCSCSVYMLKFG